MTSTNVIASAVRILAQEIHSDDGVANAALFQAAARLNEQAEEIERLRESIKILESQLADSYANELCAMGYLSEVRAIVGGDDFPDMVERVRALKNNSGRGLDLVVVRESLEYWKPKTQAEMREKMNILVSINRLL